jgi:hypothetical protein
MMKFTEFLSDSTKRRRLEQEGFVTILTKLLEGSTDIYVEREVRDCKMDCTTLQPNERKQVLDFIKKTFHDVAITTTRREVTVSDDSDDENTPYIPDSKLSKITPNFIYLNITKEEFASRLDTCFPTGTPEQSETATAASSSKKRNARVAFNLAEETAPDAPAFKR